MQCFWDVKPFQATGVQRTSMKNNDNVTKQCIFFLSMLFGYKYSNSEGLLQSSAMLLAPSGKSFLNLVKENKRRTNHAFHCFPMLSTTLPSPTRWYVRILLIPSYIWYICPWPWLGTTCDVNVSTSHKQSHGLASPFHWKHSHNSPTFALQSLHTVADCSVTCENTPCALPWHNECKCIVKIRVSNQFHAATASVQIKLDSQTRSNEHKDCVERTRH